jgi:hypothetical protein
LFGTIFHPQPVGRRRAVAELSVPGVQANSIGAGHTLLAVGVDSQHQPPAMLPQGAATSVIPQSAGLRVIVNYRLREYLQVLADFVPIELHRRAQRSGKAKSNQPKKLTWLTKGLLFTIGSAAYVYKVNRVGKCSFQIDSEGVKRVSKDGTLHAEWSEVVEVLKLSRAYLIQKTSGAMPIPFRCMTDDECAEFEHLAGSKLASSRTVELS